MKLKKLRILAIFMTFLVITLPIAVTAKVIDADTSKQTDSINQELERRFTEPPTGQDIIGEDIIINIAQYQPDVIRAGLLEDQGVVVYAVLSGIPTNPTVTIPRIRDVDILSYNVITNPPETPVKVGRIAYIPPRGGQISYSNMGYLAVPIMRIPKEADVPDEITLEVEARVLFDVSSGMGASPTKLVLRQQNSDEWGTTKEDNRYLDIYIQAEEIGSDSVTLNVYDDNLNPIAQGLKIKEGRKSRTLRRDRMYMPGQVFDKFDIYLKDIKNAGDTLDILVIRGGVPEGHTISPGEAAYHGSNIILEKIDIKQEEVVAYFRGPDGNRKFAKFPRQTVKPQDKDFNQTIFNQSINILGNLSQTNLTHIPKGTSLEKYNLAAQQFGSVVSTLAGQNRAFEYNGQNTSIGDFQAQYQKALIQHTKIKDLPAAVREYETLLQIYNSYEPERRQKTIALGIYPSKIKSAISFLNTLLNSPKEKRMVAQVEFIEQDGTSVSIVIQGSTLTSYGLSAKTSKAYIRIETPQNNSLKELTLGEGEAIDPNLFSIENSYWEIEDIREDSIILSATPNNRKITKTIPISNSNGVSLTIGNDSSSTTRKIYLDSIELHKEAHIVVSPNTERAFSAARFNMHLPIEKRAIGLPLFSETIEEEINKTEKLIIKLDKTLEKVGKIHDSWKKFCFGVYAAIASLNFLKAIFSPKGGRAKQVAADEFWTQHGDECRDLGLTLDECVFEKESEYHTILKNTEDAYKYADGSKYEAELGEFEVTDNNKEELSNLAYLQKRAEQNPQDESAQKEYLASLRATQDRTDLKDLLNGRKESELNSTETQKLRRDLVSNRSQRVDTLITSHQGQKDYITQIESAKNLQYRSNFDKVYLGDVVRFGDLDPTEQQQIKAQELADLNASGIQNPQDSINKITNSTFIYTSPTGKNIYFDVNDPGTESLVDFGTDQYTLSEEPFEYSLPHNPQVTFYRDGPNDGKVHRITIDSVHYAEVEYSTGGRVNTVNIFSRLNPNEVIKADETEWMDGELRDVIKDAEKNRNNKLATDLKKVEGCIGQINKAKSRGSDLVRCATSNKAYKITNDPVPMGPSCINYYSPNECRLLFNACDPVLCPASRCDLGGNWRVKDDNVVQTGIIGSSILCLHNFGIPGTDIGPKGGQVIMPICITGIYAGLQNLRTVLLEYNDCLKRSLVDGESVGVCDLIRSYYICDILWKEATAIFNLKDGLLRSVIEKVRGDEDEGSEYTDFDASMDQAVNGLKYFTQGYAKNTFAQFSGGSLPEVGGEICKSAIFGKMPGMGSFTEQLLRPESPPQFTAILDKVPYTDIPDRPRAEYQVYYRIYAGANEPITFSVYLKQSGVESQRLPVIPILQNKRLPADAFDSETRNFVAPEGYNQVCVAYNSPSYGLREECGFGKTSSGFAMEYAANRLAQMEATEGGIQMAEQCNPSGSRFSAAGANHLTNVGRIAAGGFSSGLLETGIVRVCSGVAPGEEKEWTRVGECWEKEGKQGRNLGSCWLHLPSAKSIVTEYATGQEDWGKIGEELADLSDKTISDMAAYANNLGIHLGYLTEEEITKARTLIVQEKANNNWNLVAKTYSDLINSPIANAALILQFRMELADWYRRWGDSLANTP